MTRIRSPLRFALSAFALTGLGACQTAYEEQGTGAQTSVAAPSDVAHDNPLAFAQGACGGCHAVEKPWLSPNPASPTFADIANREGVTEDTLQAYLTDAHNYPMVMDFDLDPEQAEELAHYILTLRDPDYRKPPS